MTVDCASIGPPLDARNRLLPPGRGGAIDIREVVAGAIDIRGAALMPAPRLGRFMADAGCGRLVPYCELKPLIVW